MPTDNIPQKLLMPNTTQIPNVMLDVIMPAVSPGTWKIISCVARQTYGWQKRWDAISISTVEKKTGLSNRFVIDTMEAMREAGLLLRREGERKEFGFEYSLNIDCDMAQAAERLKTVERKPRITPSGGRKNARKEGEAGSEAGSPEAMNPVHEGDDSGHEPTSHGHELSADAASSQGAMNSVPEAMNPVHTQKPTVFKTHYPNQKELSPSVLLIAQSNFMKNLKPSFREMENGVGLHDENPRATIFYRVRIAAKEAGFSYTQAKEFLQDHPLWSAWPDLKDLDSQQEINFPEPEKPKPMGQVEFPPEFKADGTTWLKILAKLEKKVARLSYDTWFKPTRGIGVYRRILYIHVPVIEFRQISERFGDLLQTAMDEVCGDQVIDIKFCTQEEMAAQKWEAAA